MRSALRSLERCLLPIGLALAVNACGGSTDTTGNAGAAGNAGSGASSGSGGGGGGGDCESFVPCCDSNGRSVEPVCDSNDNPTCPPGSSFPPSGVCTSGGCSATKPCAADSYCDYPDDRCGEGSPGTCRPKPQGCDLSYAPVCSCAGQVEGNACAAHSAGSDLDKRGGCTAPSGTFGCGDIFCELKTQYCQRATSDVGGYPDGYRCLPLPQACATALSCDCVKGEPCAEYCELDGAQLTLTCPGG